MSDQNEEWGPWIEHDGKGCPCKGMWAQMAYRDILSRYDQPDMMEGWVKGDLGPQSGWLLENATDVKVIIRYRIRKPRALSQLQEMIRNLPERIDA